MWQMRSIIYRKFDVINLFFRSINKVIIIQNQCNFYKPKGKLIVLIDNGMMQVS